MGLWNRFMNGLSGFREGFLNADPQQARRRLGDFDEFGRFEGRQMRYDLFWGFYESNAFRELVHSWAAEVKAQFGLYRDTRNIYNPVQRLVEFWVTHTWGGCLDSAAGDGQRVRSAIPIETENEYLRPAIARLWRDSRWQTKKSLACRFGSCFGDVGIKVVDDPQRRRPTLKVIHPGKLKWIERDDDGWILSYILEETRFDPRPVNLGNLNPLLDPRATKQVVTYSEEAFVEGGKVVYRTYLNGTPWNWRGQSEDGGELPAEWTVPYPFIPLVTVQHKDIGLDWGMGEPHTLVSKVFEVDDMASGLGDQVRKAIRAPKLVTGVRGASDIVNPAGSGGDPSPSRQSIPLYTTPNEKAQTHDLTFNLDIAAVNDHIKRINEEIERDYPELQLDIWTTGDPSGRALRVARQRTDEKVQERRPAYDDSLVRAQRIALAIGGLRSYPGYEGLGTLDPMDPILDHAIGHRPVFAPDPLDDIEEGTAFWQMAGAAVTAGMPLEVFLEREGWDPADIAKITSAKEAAANKAMETIKQRQQLAMADTGPGVAE
jgi:hypothetical protein